ncbi:ABC-type lipoprotein release transport system permease subunit [Halarchaeum solikamskense]|uniref:FtsX-like permease family protein n=1 Tax=Halarchaeum nitratireducens TaxID=489913 RepID=UPI001B3AE62B|nr:ABC-type lipoprotein release transport system permease subunit [Halarchaeum solikamskense]
MSYRRALLTRWSLRDRLAVLVVAVTAAFLVGAVLVLLAVSGQATAMAADHGADAAVVLTSDVPDGAPPGAAVFPLTTARVAGDAHTVVGVPRPNPLGLDPPDGVAGSPVGTTVELAGPDATVSRASVDRTADAPFPDGWLVTDAATVRELGAERALVVRDAESAVPEPGAPLVGALSFFLAGTAGVLETLGVVCAGVAVLVGVVVFSVTRMTVRERRSTLVALRATGASARRVRRLVAVRAALLTLAGATLGYGIGVIAPNAAATAAVRFGLPVGLPLSLDTRAAALVGAILLALVCVGGLAGALAARPVVGGAPLDESDTGSRGWPGGPRLLPARAVVPTTATLTVFVAFVLVVAALGGVLGSLGATGEGAGGVVTEPGSVHPVDSHVPVAYADELRHSGVAASPEILLFLAHDGRAFPARGVDFDAYRAVSDATLVAGRAPTASDEAVVGDDLARTLGVDPGDSLALGGSTVAAVGTVDVVGTYDAPGAADDHLLVSLPLARHLEGVPAGAANVVRFGGARAANGTVAVLGVSAPDRVARGETVTLRVRLRNVGDDAATRTVRAAFDGARETRSVALDAGERRTASFDFAANAAGTHTARVAGATRRVRVVAPGTLTLAPLPARGPPNASLDVAVGTVAGERVEGARVAIGSNANATTADGATRVRLPATPGRYEMRASAGDRRATRTVRVADGAVRGPGVRLHVPERVSVFGAPRAALRVTNPWPAPLERSASITGPGVDRTTTVALDPGAERTVTAAIARRPPGSYDVAARVGNATASTSYRVTGDARLASALAASGRSAGGVGTAGILSRAFGNLGLVLATLLGLGVLMTVGSIVATFADAVQARRRDLGVHRAIGADPRWVVGTVLADAARIALPATVAGLALAWLTLRALSWAGALTAFGVRVAPSVPLWTVAPVALGTFALALVGAGALAVRDARLDPSRLLGGGR